MNDTVHKGKSIMLFLVDGSPQGVQTAEVMNWTGHVVSGPRIKIAELALRQELSRTGVYFLTGPDSESMGKMRVYIGESDNVKKRLVQHNKDDDKEFWDRAFVVTSKDANLTKTHARYLESHLLSIARASGRVNIHNKTLAESDDDALPEALIADMEYFISQIRLILPVLGLEFLREKPKVTHVQTNEILEEVGKKSSVSPIFVAQSKKHNLKAEAQVVEDEFIVFKGSEARAKWSSVQYHHYSQLHDLLIKEGKLVVAKDGKKAIFEEDTPFKSPSAASAVVFGRGGGRTEWKVKNAQNKTYSDWDEEQLAISQEEFEKKGN